ncbi:hypothetical protein CEUSTIGMA_g2903.t1 [Chlamydomonas eustigma]|uniref:palmitoyl-protein hydrolase n=1 Tax=Chlamydomonas eustigma TaxID=1157962 RepID=A0A250WY67_9CHLO|nr:hypothetical protein CEUSTIGMA_g2903.t1 [Chlamydomonas eustigma]|eukprot:GAX75460.1 hypothetical protein CEUSTIGMA_g2903.t1 [Chlamydomonas eustigma]
MTIALLGKFGSRAQLIRNPRSNLTCASTAPSMSSSNLSYPKPLVSEPSSPHSGTVIMLHGLGDTGSGWSDIAADFQSQLKHVKFIFPTAPQRSISLNMGMKMTGWYDIASLEDINQKEDASGLRESQRYVEELISKEVAAGIPSNRVVVAGFSQGGAIALLMLRSHLKLAGVVGLSTYLPLRDQSPVVSEANLHTPVLMCHGDSDMVVRHEYGRQSFDQLQKLGVPADFKTYGGMGHSACPAELREFVEFLKRQLK